MIANENETFRRLIRKKQTLFVQINSHQRQTTTLYVRIRRQVVWTFTPERGRTKDEHISSKRDTIVIILGRTRELRRGRGLIERQKPSLPKQTRVQTLQRLVRKTSKIARSS